MDALSGNWIWLLLAIFIAWFFMRRRGLHGHGMGGHGRSHRDSWRSAGRRVDTAGGHESHGADPAAQPEWENRSPAGAAPAAALDPVTGNPVRTDRARSAVFGGRAYYFESEETRERFEADPQKYASAAPAPAERPRRRRGC